MENQDTFGPILKRLDGYITVNLSGQTERVLLRSNSKDNRIRLQQILVGTPWTPTASRLVSVRNEYPETRPMPPNNRAVWGEAPVPKSKSSVNLKTESSIHAETGARQLPVNFVGEAAGIAGAAF